jgi:uncharacterized damage-inducible protein DinB
MSIERVEPPYGEEDRAALRSWLEYHRATLLVKCEGLDAAGLAARPIPTSMMSLHGLVRHMTEVERNWFRRWWLQEQDVPPLYWDDDEHPDGDFELADGSTWDADLATFLGECDHSRAVEAGAESLDVMSHRPGRDVGVDRRWIMIHMIEEYARHNGHADLIRELVDGSVGD